jgi:hypothetical protein
LRGLSTTRAGTLLKQQIPTCCTEVRKRCWQHSNEREHCSLFQFWGLIPITVARRINEGVIAYCEQERITFTRGRPNLKNDQCNTLAEKWSDRAKGWWAMIAS